VPILLAVAGVALIIAGQLDLAEPGPGPSLPPIPEPTSSPVAQATPTPSGTGSASAKPSASPTPSPTPNPKWVAVQMQIPSVGINIRVQKAATKQDCDFPPEFGAWVLCGGSEPGRGTNSYIFAHAQVGMFLPLWNVQLGAEIRVLMSDGKVLRYRVTEMHPNVSCPDTRAPTMPPNLEPLALKYAPGDCREGALWSRPSNHERLTLQTSQGPNRNWGEFIVIAEPA
jgi:Sortase domain